MSRPGTSALQYPLALILFAAVTQPVHLAASATARPPSQRLESPLPIPLEESAAAALGGRLYVMGGLDSAGRDLDTTFIFDGRKWSAGPRLPLALDHPSAAVAGGHLYLVGGFSGGVASDRSFVLSSHRSWVPAGRLRYARGAQALVGLTGSLYALGGKDGNGFEVRPIEVYHLATARWTVLASLPAPRDHLAGFSYRSQACVAGGRTPNTARVDCFDPARRSWRRLPDLPVATSGAGAATLGGEVIVGGGELAGEGESVITQMARLRKGRWITGAMLLPRHGTQFAVFAGRIWACGGGIAPGLHPVRACTSFQ